MADLFSEPVDLDYEIRRLARRDDPEPSKEAARIVALELGRVRQEVLGMVVNMPGSTVNELALAYDLRDPRHVGRRLPELEEQGLVRRGEARECRVTGRNAATWTAA